jgi:hypothetical protein
MFRFQHHSLEENFQACLFRCSFSADSRVLLAVSHVLRVNAKRKAVDDLSARPSKVIKSELQTMNEKSLEPKDLGS